jgi:beta-lactamase class A
MIVDSDGAATDFLITRLGGPKQIQTILEKKGLRGFNIDRDERDLDAEQTGLRWDPKYIDEKLLHQAMSVLPAARQDQGFRNSQHHDTGTPVGVANLLESLVQSSLLSPPSSALLLDIMSKTRTFPDRLKAGVPESWRVAHKTGTSGAWNGVTAATNDVGILTAPNSGTVMVSVFISRSRATDADRAKTIADVARAIVSCYGK